MKSERLARLNALLEDQRQAFNRTKVCAVMPVLFERIGRHPGQMIGRSPWLQSVWAEAPASLMGEVAEVEITDVGPNSLVGRLVNARGAAA